LEAKEDGYFAEEDTKVLVQGITGREGSARAAFMKGYGTNVVAGVTPGGVEKWSTGSPFTTRY